MTKWERVFRSHYPDAGIDDFKPTLTSRKKFWIYRRGSHHLALGAGFTPAEAWRNACASLGLVAEKTGTP